MKICIVSHEYPPNMGSGVGTGLKNLVDGLLESGHKVTVITPLLRGGAAHEKIGSLEIFRVKIPKLEMLKRLILVDRSILFGLFLKKFHEVDFGNFDILHIYDAHDGYFLNKRIKKSVRVVISVNEYYCYATPFNPLKFPFKTSNFLQRYVHSMLTKIFNTRLIKKADFIITNTMYTKDVLRDKIGIPEMKMKVIYRGLVTENFTVSKNKYESLKILYIGNNMERKGVKYLLLAMPEIKKVFPGARLTAIGHGDSTSKRKLHKIVKKHNLCECVKFIDYAPPEDIRKYYSESNVFVLPAVIENLAVVLLEAMASGTPVVCTHVGANAEAITEKTGIFVRPCSSKEISRAIIRIFSDKEMARRMGAEGIRRVNEKFSKNIMVNEVLGVYRKIRKT